LGERILSRADTAFDGIFHRNHGRVSAPINHRGQRVPDVIDGKPFLAFRFGNLSERGPGESAHGS
jgi:hypothetical protein